MIDKSVVFSDKPLFDDDAPKVIDLEEGLPALVNVTALANPSKIEYSWSKDEFPRVSIPDNDLGNSGAGDREMKSLNEARTLNRIFSNQGVLNVSEVRREDSGFYTIKATNDEGTTQRRIRINVLFKPR